MVAAALVAFLVAGNFGLIRSPFGPVAAANAPSFPTIVAAPVGTDTARPNPTNAPSISAKPVTPPAPAGTADRTPPNAAFTSANGTQVSATESASVFGTVDDDASGVRDVVVTFVPESGEPMSRPATVTCADESRTSCTWAADVPSVLGNYEVSARATDRAGNVRDIGPSTISVVNLGGVVGDLLGGLLGP